MFECQRSPEKLPVESFGGRYSSEYICAFYLEKDISCVILNGYAYVR